MHAVGSWAVPLDLPAEVGRLQKVSGSNWLAFWVGVPIWEIGGNLGIQIVQSEGERESTRGGQLCSPLGTFQARLEGRQQPSRWWLQLWQYWAILEFKSPKAMSEGNRVDLRDPNSETARQLVWQLSRRLARGDRVDRPGGRSCWPSLANLGNLNLAGPVSAPIEAIFAIQMPGQSAREPSRRLAGEDRVDRPTGRR